ncbi:cytochrome-c peroxidase [Lignipirellula cremea]|uniref:cytochrome-c peroxidase n=1 Tax=Lignipirellula cremea TaxID=2528010 RepID=UPI0018D26E1A|nr:cytochrome c peroxidase [Lignipirellula cremea]
MKRLFLCVLLLSFSTVVAQEPNDSQPESQTAKRKLAPLPRAASAPNDNPTTPAKVELGKTLFFDPRLSGDNKMSCATCHIPDKAYGDGLALSPGAGGKLLVRNTPTCLNVGFLNRFFWDGRAVSLEEQALGPIQSPVEMNQNLEELEAELAEIPGYVSEFEKVFGTKPRSDGIAKALAAFQRTLVTEPSPFDRYLEGDKDALSDRAKKGLELFQGDAGCIRCHSGPLLSDEEFYRIGVFSKDEGRAIVTGKKEDRYRFRTPTLRNIAQTGPYMHNGSLKTLESVVTFYYRDIPETGRDGLPLDAEALSGQSYSEIGLIVEFLKSLTGKTPKVVPPTLP